MAKIWYISPIRNRVSASKTNFTHKKTMEPVKLKLYHILTWHWRDCFHYMSMCLYASIVVQVKFNVFQYQASTIYSNNLLHCRYVRYGTCQALHVIYVYTVLSVWRSSGAGWNFKYSIFLDSWNNSVLGRNNPTGRLAWCNLLGENNRIKKLALTRLRMGNNSHGAVGVLWVGQLSLDLHKQFYNNAHISFYA